MAENKIWQVWRPLINHPRKRDFGAKVLYFLRSYEKYIALDLINIWIQTINYIFNGLFDKQSNSPINIQIEYYFSNKWHIISFYLLHHKKVNINHDNMNTILKTLYYVASSCALLARFYLPIYSKNFSYLQTKFYSIKSCRGNLFCSSIVLLTNPFNPEILFDLVKWKFLKHLFFEDNCTLWDYLKSPLTKPSSSKHHWMQNWKCLFPLLLSSSPLSYF